MKKDIALFGAAALAALLAVGLGGPALAQGASPSSQTSSGVSATDTGVNDLVTDSVGQDFSAVASECGAIDKIYRVDCLRQGIDLTARSIPYHGDYSTARRTLTDAANALGTIVRNSTDRSAPRYQVKPNSNPRFQSRRYYAAVPLTDARTADAVRQAIQSAKSSIEQQGEKQDSWKPHYTKIAQNLDSLVALLQN